jgi:hypothetical protein
MTRHSGFPFLHKHQYSIKKTAGKACGFLFGDESGCRLAAHHCAVNHFTSLCTRGEITSTEMKAIGHAIMKLRAQCRKKFWEPKLTIVNIRVTMKATIIDISSENIGCAWR